jgi:hypothetical protein
MLSYISVIFGFGFFLLAPLSIRGRLLAAGYLDRL